MSLVEDVEARSSSESLEAVVSEASPDGAGVSRSPSEPPPPVSRKPLLALALCLGASLAVALSACSVHSIERALMTTAYRPRPTPSASSPPFMLLAGDAHCHVSPPDDASEVRRGVAETVKIARDEGLDFVVFTPHVPGRFYMDKALRADAVAGQRALRAAIAAATTPDGPALVAGFEYTDVEFGHVGASFGDLEAVLAEVPIDVAKADPARFFQSWTAHGGLLVVNHPVVTPFESMFNRARGDMSWRPWTRLDAKIPPEIAAIHKLAVGFEAYNAAVAQMRDRLFVGDSSFGLREVMSRMDLEIQTAQRPLVAIGGSDSHAGYLRAAMFLLATSRTPEGVRDAIVHGRTCVKSPDACSLEVRADDAAWLPIGTALHGAREIELRVRSDEPVTILREGGVLLAPRKLAEGESIRIAVEPGVCNVFRARVGEGYSGAIYVNCDTFEPTEVRSAALSD